MSMTQQAKQTQQQPPMLDAIYENGVFRPLHPVGQEIKEGEKVALRVYSVSAALKALEELTHIFDGLPEEEIQEIEKIALRRIRSRGLQQADAEQTGVQ